MKTVLLVSLAILSGCASAPSTVTPYANVRGDKGYCPICTMWHPASEMKWPVQVNGRWFAFCDPNCRAMFARNPERYLSDPEMRPSPTFDPR